MNRTPCFHGIFITTLLIALPIVWGTPEPDQVDPKLYALHAIPPDASKIDAWFHSIIRPARERKDLEPDLVEAEKKLEVIRVRQDGSGKFKTIMEAVNTVEARGNDNRVIIDIGPGVYKEKIKIDRYRPYITLYGDPNDMPTLIFNDCVPNVQAMDTATLTVEGDYFSGINLKIINGGSLQKDQTAIAVRVMGEYASFYNCKMTSYKGTLLDDTGRHFFKDCLIIGGSDIIFGDGRSIYLSTEIHAMPFQPVSIITAQARKNTLDGKGGNFIFAHCKVSGDEKTQALLGRTYMAGSRVLFAYSSMSSVIQPKGWYDNFDTDYEKTAIFGEYMNTGPGAVLTGRIKEPCTRPTGKDQVFVFLNLQYIDATSWLLPPPQLVASKATTKSTN